MSRPPEGFVHLLRQQARTRPERVVARFEGRLISIADIDRQSDAVAAGLRGRGIGRGDVAGVMLSNRPETLALLFGLAKAGIVWLPINVRQRGAGLRYQLETSAPRLLIVDKALAGVVGECGAEIDPSRILHAGSAEEPDALEELLSADARFDEMLPEVSDPFAIMYTSGTTGAPKAVVVTHSMLRLAGEAALLVSAARDGDTLFVWEPFFHIGGAQLLAAVLIHDITLAMVPRLSVSRFWDEVREAGATHIHYLGGLLQMLLGQPAGARDREHPVRIAWGGGCPADVWTAFRDRFGVEVRECYGMTETSSITTYWDGGPVGSIGKPVPWFQVELVDENGAPVPQGKRGMIAVRALAEGAMFSGYVNNAAVNAEVLRDGLFLTGDIGSRDGEGNLFFHGRSSESMRCKGENVSAWEVESVAARHPSVEDCAAVGVAAEVGEQEIKLFVRPKEGAGFDAARLAAWLRGELASYQVPRYIAVVDAFERTPSERIIKQKLSRSIEDCWDSAKA